MPKSLRLYFIYQIPYLLFLFGVFVIPLGLFFKFSTYTLPKIQYVFLGSLILSQYFSFKEKPFRKKIEEKVVSNLKKETGKLPSRKEIILRSDIVIRHRGVTVALGSLGIFLLMVIFNQF